jgi:hypothetical protein
LPSNPILAFLVQGHQRSALVAPKQVAAVAPLEGCCRIGFAVLSLTLAAVAPVYAQTASSATAPSPTPSSAGSDTELAEVVINGIPQYETVLPTRLSLDTVYGFDLNVLDTPRNTTLLSTTQLQTLNIQDPRAFSYLTSSSYSDSSFGTPAIPRIRGQYGDVFYNGMRDSFSQNGYGAPLNYDSFQNISITKGPAGVIDGPGPNVGGEVEFLTKRPSLFHLVSNASASVDSLGNRRVVADLGGPINTGTLGALLSYSGEDSTDNYFTGHYMRKNAVYAAVRWQPSDAYRLDFNTEVNAETYTEDVGVNRINQNLIDHGSYLQGAPTGELDSSVLFANNGAPIPVGLAAGFGSPYSAAPFFTEVNLTNAVRINPKITIDEAPGVVTRALLYNAQLIQTYRISSGLTLENNTFFAFQNSTNQAPYYFSDSSNGSYSIESRTDLSGGFALPVGSSVIDNKFAIGATFRFAHTNYISDYSAEAVSVYDLTGNPNLWHFPAAYQGLADASAYQAPFGMTVYGVPGRDVVNAGNTGVSDLDDLGVFFQDRMEFNPELSALYGARMDAVQNHSRDPLGGIDCSACFTTLPQNHTTAVYGLAQFNASLVYKLRPRISSYLTVDWVQSNNSPNGGIGGINTYGQSPDAFLLRTDNYLYEAGLKFEVLDQKLFSGMALFEQKRRIPSGAAGTQTIPATIRGVEMEANYQPTRSLYATASYSYIRTVLKAAPLFYDYPSQSGINIDGAANYAVFKPGQTFLDPGVPEHLFNFLGNYKFGNGVGVRTGVQVTGPIATTPSGFLDVAASSTVYGTYVPQIASQISGVTDSRGYYHSPVIPWQYTWNGAVFYEFGKSTLTLSVYNLTDRRNWQPSPTFYGNDFLVRSDPRTFELRLQVAL